MPESRTLAELIVDAGSDLPDETAPLDILQARYSLARLSVVAWRAQVGKYNRLIGAAKKRHRKAIRDSLRIRRILRRKEAQPWPTE